MRNIFSGLFLQAIAHSALALELNLFSDFFEPVELGFTRVDIPLSDFEVLLENSTETKVEAVWMEDSLQWIRAPGGHLLPRARILIKVFKPAPLLYAYYDNKVLQFRQLPAWSELDVPLVLFDGSPIQIFSSGISIARISIQARENPQRIRSQFIDHSCTPFDVQIIGIQGQYLSANCNAQRVGRPGSESGIVEVIWSATGYRLADGKYPPFAARLNPDGHPAKIDVINKHGETRTVQITANIPRRWHRLKGSGSLGLHRSQSWTGVESRGDFSQRRSSTMLGATGYLNFFLTPSSSIRAFNSFFPSPGTFNNFGFYFAYDVASLFQNRVKIIPLLGGQLVSFQHHRENPLHHGSFPQGGEILYNHPFGLKNYSLLGGALFLNSNNLKYRNFWLRAGSDFFVEANYIQWVGFERQFETWGASLGLPLLSLF